VLDGLADVDVEVLLTVGPGNDPGALSPLPANAHVEPYVPQSLLLPRCAVVICHGGAGTTLGALAHGLPLLVLPQGADQYVIGERLVSSGAGLCLLMGEVNASTVRSAVLELLNGVDHRAAARRVQQEIGAMPGPKQTVALIEEWTPAR
jgi:MGT family glycosyltransferase